MTEASLNFLKSNIGILAHGDADGICSSAIIKSIFPGAFVLFSKATDLHKDIKDIEKRIKTLDRLYIVDIAINPKQSEFVVERLEKAISKYEIYYYDNHILPENINQKDLSKLLTKYISKIDSSSSIISFIELFGESTEKIINNRFQAFLAAYGAISDYAKKAPLLLKILDLFDEASLYYQAYLLKQASRVIQSDDVKRSITDKLSVGILPSEIIEVMEASQEASREADLAINFIQKNALTHGNVGIIFECPVASMGHNAFIAATMTNSPLGISIRRQGGNAHFILRKRHGELVHLGFLASRVAKKLNCDGGGEEATAGITSQDDQIFRVIQEIDNQFNLNGTSS